MSYFINLSGILLCVLALFSIIINKNIGILHKINASIYIIALGVYIYFSEKLIIYIKILYGANYSFVNIFSTILNAISLTGALIIFLGAFIKSEKFQKYAYNVYELLVFLLSAVLIINLFYSNKKSVFLLPLVILTLVLSISAVLNSSEKLDTKNSKFTYFIINSIIALFWIIGISSLSQIKGFSVNSSFIVLLTISIILSFSSIIFGILRIRKKTEKVNQEV